jgi:hypothetical protein
LVCCKHMDFQNLWIPYKIKVQQSFLRYYYINHISLCSIL